MQLYLSIGIPSVVALVSWVTVIPAWLLDRSDNSRLNEKLDRLTETLRAKMTSIPDDHHKDYPALMGYMVPLHERMTKLESHI